jgi:putative OPT family oligopeptide transporter
LAHDPPPEPAPGPAGDFKPYIPPEVEVPEFTPKAVVFGSIFGIIFGASTVYLALKAGLTVSASIPIAVLSISVLRLFGRATILENNIVQTIGSAGESVAAGVAFTIPALIFLSPGARGEDYFQYLQIMMLAAAGGTLGVLFMVPLRRSLIVAEHGTLPYPEGTACAEVLVAGEKGGRMARLVFGGVIFAFIYKLLNTVFSFWKEAPTYVTQRGSVLPSATVSAEVSPEYLGVGYILGPRVGGIMVAGGILSWIVLIPLLALLVPEQRVVADLVALGRTEEAVKAWGEPRRIYEAYIRYVGAGAVTMAGIITLLKTMPTIVRSLRESIAALRRREAGGSLRTERDIPISVVALGSVALALVLAILPILPGGFGGKLLMAVLMLVFGFLFVTVSSRIVGLIGSTSNPISGMTIATLLGTCLVFISLGMGGDANQPIALSVGAIVCIAAANAGATSQDLKTGYLVGATPIRQQVGLVIGVLVSTLVIGLTIKWLDATYAEVEGGHGIGSARFPAPQATLMATVIKGVMSQNLPWGYVLVGAGLSLMVYLSGVSPLAWAVGAYLPISTTMSIFLGGLVRGLVDRLRGAAAKSDVSPGMLFATGLVAGGALTGIATGILKWIDSPTPENPRRTLLEACQGPGEDFQKTLAESLGAHAPDVLGILCFAVMAAALVGVALRRVSVHGGEER